MRSMYKSCTSGPVFVNPHAMRSLCPSTTLGMPGSVPPMTFNPGADKCARYQIEGMLKLKCGSFARSGVPVSDKAPDTTQLFEPLPWTSEGGAACATLLNCCAVPARLRYKPV